MTRIAQGTSVPIQNDTARAIASLIDTELVSPQQSVLEHLRWLDELTHTIHDLANRSQRASNDEMWTALMRIETLSGLANHLSDGAQATCEQSIEATEKEHKPAILAAVKGRATARYGEGGT